MQQLWEDWINLILGIVVLISPAFLAIAPTGPIAGNAYVSGGIITLVALIGLVLPQQWEEWINLIVGIWLMSSPFVLGFTGGRASMIMIVAGTLVFVFSVWALIDLSKGGVATA